MLSLRLLAFSILLLNFQQAKNPKKVTYTIDSNSKMLLNISTNVNDFNCNCEENFEKIYYTTEIDDKTIPIYLNLARLKINVKSMNCKNALLNKDLYKSLEAEKYPTINFELHSIIPNHIDKTLTINKLYEFVAQTTISIAGVPKKQFIKVSLQKIANDTFRVKALKEISMAEYGIKPLSPIGFIKIKDKVNVNFDLIIKTHSL